MMNNLLFLFCSFILKGVSAAAADVTVSVMERDSVTLHTYPDEIKGADALVWNVGDRIIAKLDIEGKTKPEYPDETLRSRLTMHHHTGSLTISNITSEDSKEYELQIRGSRETKKTFRVDLNELNTLFLMETDSYILQTGVKIQTDDVIQWKFNGDVLTDRKSNCEVNPQTGNLNITNITHKQSGDYQLNVTGRTIIVHKIFRINVSELEPLSVNEGDSVILHTGTETRADDVIKWKFEGTVIAEFHRMNNFIKYTDPDGRFTGRLVLNDQTGSLTITGIRSEDSGHYDVNINNRQHIIHKRFNVSVTENTHTFWKKIGPGLLCGVIMLVLIVIGLVLVIIYYRKRLAKKEIMETRQPLNQQSSNTNDTMDTQYS